MSHKFADLHCHPHSRAFHWMRHSRNERKHTRRFHAWNVVLSNFKKQEKGKRAFSYSQCDPVKLWNGETKLVFASLYPFEKGFYKGGTMDQSKLIQLLDTVSTIGLGTLNPFKFIRVLMNFMTGSASLLKSIRSVFQSLLMRMPLRRIKYFLSPEYDYYRELIRERDFLLAMDGKEVKNHIYIPGIKNIFKRAKKLRRNYPESLDATGKYVICQNFSEVESATANDEIAMVLTIEGMHALGTDTSLEKVEQRIMEIKAWPTPVFFITIAHHFNNYLCGHAHSMMDNLKFLSDQSEGMNAGFTDEGKRALRLLLSLNENLDRESTLGKRILPDFKHTAALSRKWYYEHILAPCLHKGDTIPVILSHVAFSGWNTLDEAIEYAPKENDDDLRNGFYPWNINACGEDVVWVAKTRGLIGLCFDQRILGDAKDKTNSIDLICKNLLAMTDVILDSTALNQDQKQQCWACFSIGTDFEGYIDPTQDYSNSLEFADFRRDLVSKLWSLSEIEKEKYGLNTTTQIESVVEGICFRNTYEFLKRNF